MDAPSTIDVGPLVMGLAGGLALFLYGMQQLTDALKQAAGSRMKSLLERMTTNRLRGALAGATVTAVIQSSSVTTVLVVGFVSAGLMTLPQAIGVILGADIGTTVTAQIVAFKVTKYALALISAGFLIQFLARRDALRLYGTMLLGLGLLFFGMELMSEATTPLRSFGPFLSLMGGMDNALIGILFGTAFTAIIQSSSAAMGIVIVLAAQGFLSLEAGIALVFGANIGTCATALLAAVGKPREAVRAAVVHVVFKVVGVLLWFAFIDPMADLIRWMSPSEASLAGAARLAAETPRQIANAHTLFNVVNTLLFLPFTGAFAWLVTRLVPDRPEAAAPEATVARYLDDHLLDTPALALDRVRMELRRLADRATAMVRDALPAALDGTEEDLAALQERDASLDDLHAAVVTYLGQLAGGTLGPEDAALHARYLEAANSIEHIGDLIETNLVRTGQTRLAAGITVSPGTREKLVALHARVLDATQLAFQALDADNPRMAARVVEAKADLQRLAAEAEVQLTSRLSADAPDRLELYRFESELIEYLRRVYYFAKRIARAQAEESAPRP
jgi:phosphate:Na+ symporter